MKPKKAIKELRKQLKTDPGNLVLMIRLASLLRDTGQLGEAVQLYMSVAYTYQSTGRSGQAIAVCKGVLEFAPDFEGARQMLTHLEQQRLQNEVAAPVEPRPGGPMPLPTASSARRKRPTSMPTPLDERSVATALPGFGSTTAERSRVGERTRERTRAGERTRERSRVREPRRARPSTRPPAPGQMTRGRSGLALNLPLQGPRDRSGALRMPVRPGERGDPESAVTRPRLDEEVRKAGLVPQGKAPPVNPLGPTDAIPAQPPAAGTAQEREELRRRLPLTPPADSHPDLRSKLPVQARARPAPPRTPEPISPSTLVPEQTVPARRRRPANTLQRVSPGGGKVPSPGRSATPIPSRPILTPPAPPPLADPQTAPGEERYEPELEDATIVDAGFNLAKFMANEAQSQEIASDELPAVPRAETEPQVQGVEPSKLSPFASLPDYALEELAQGAIVHQYNGGDMVLREGDPGDSCFVLVHGELQVLKRDPLNPSAEAQEVARLVDGTLFGEFALLGDRLRHATVEATRSSLVYEIPRHVIETLQDVYPAIQPILEHFYRERMVETLMATAPFFRVLTEEQRQSVVGLFEPVRASAGQVIIREGHKSGGFYLVLLGQVRIDKRNEQGQQVPVATLGEGAYFGEVSLLRGDVAQATATALGTVELARLEAKRFYSLVASIPMLWAQVWQEANRRELESLQIVAGTTGNV